MESEGEFSNPDSFRSQNSDSMCPSLHNTNTNNTGGFSSINDLHTTGPDTPGTNSASAGPTVVVPPGSAPPGLGGLAPVSLDFLAMPPPPPPLHPQVPQNPGSSDVVRRSASGVLRCHGSDNDGDREENDEEEEEDEVDDEEDDHNFRESQNLLPHHDAMRHGGMHPDHHGFDNGSIFHDDSDPFDGLHRQMSLMTNDFNYKFDALDGFGASAALSEIRCQLHELTRSVENCQSEVFEVRQDMMSIKHEIDSVQLVKEEIDDIRVSIERLECDGERRKAKLLEHGLTFFLGYSIFSAVLGMLQFGYNTGVINAPELVIEKFIRFAYRKRYDGMNMSYKASTFLYAIAVSIFALGGMCGGFFGGWIANKFGRKGGLLINNVIGIMGASAMGMAKFAESYELLIMGRFLIGVNCGLNTSLVPMYISEIAPLTLRGGLGTINQLAVTVGLLISQILGVERLLGTDNGWPYLLGIAIVPPVLQLILLPFCPESPRFLLMSRQQENLARAALKKLRNTNDIDDDIAEMKAEELAQMSESKITMFELLRSPSLRLPLLIAIVMQLSQQLSGINAVFYYSTNLFMTTGLSDSNAKYATIGIGTVMVAMTLISIPLMDRSGRRTLHLYGLGGMFIFSIFITISFLVKELVSWIWWLSVVSTLFYVVFFAVGPGSIPWMITAELFSQGPRPAAMSLAVLVNWSANFLVGIGFPTMQTMLANYTFLPFSVFLAAFWCFTYKKVPETKNKTFDEIATLFRTGQKPQRSIMNCVNSIGNASMCDHKPIIPTDAKGGGDMPNGTHPPPPPPHEQHLPSIPPPHHPDYPPLMDSYPSSPSSMKSHSPVEDGPPDGPDEEDIDDEEEEEEESHSDEHDDDPHHQPLRHPGHHGHMVGGGQSHPHHQRRRSAGGGGPQRMMMMTSYEDICHSSSLPGTSRNSSTKTSIKSNFVDERESR